MNTFGGLVVSHQDAERGLEMVLKDLPFVLRDGMSGVFEIEVPSLSLKEVRRLNECLPGDAVEQCILETGLPVSDVMAYAKIYRYYPHLVEIIG